MTTRGRNEPRVVSLKVTLRGLRPPIWRRIWMPQSMTLFELHHAIQAAMGWETAHLHMFEIGGNFYGDRSMGDDVDDETGTALGDLLQAGVTRFSYTYDFGDSWDHSILIEKKPPPADAPAYPVCVAGRRACPPEDCGGIPGYAHILNALADPDNAVNDEDLEFIEEWLEDGFNPDAFSVEEADARVAARFRRP